MGLSQPQLEPPGKAPDRAPLATIALHCLYRPRPSSLGHGRSPPSSSAPTKLSRPPSTFEHRCLRHLLPTRHPSRCLGASELYLDRLRPLPWSPDARLPNRHFGRPTSTPNASAILSQLGIQVDASMPLNSTLVASDLRLDRPTPDFQIGTSVIRPPSRTPPPSPPGPASKLAPRCLRTPPRSPSTSTPVARRPTAKLALRSSDLHPGHLRLLRPLSSSSGLQVHKPPGLRASLRPPSKLSATLGLPAKSLRTSQPPLAPSGSPGLPQPSSADAPGLPRPSSMDAPDLPRPPSIDAPGLPRPPGEAPSDVSASLSSLRLSQPSSASKHGCSRPPLG